TMAVWDASFPVAATAWYRLAAICTAPLRPRTHRPAGTRQFNGLRCAEDKQGDRQCRKVRSNIAKELLQSRQRGSARVSDGKFPFTTSAWLTARQSTGSLQLEHGPVRSSLRTTWRRSFPLQVAQPSRGYRPLGGSIRVRIDP